MVYKNVPYQYGLGHPPSRSYQIRLYMYYSDQWNYSIRYFTAMDVLRLVIRNRDTRTLLDRSVLVGPWSRSVNPWQGGHTNATSMATSRLALIFDWLLFNESRNTIMDIEPCILMMHHSRRNNPALTHVLLECILRTIKEFHLPMVEDIRNEVENFSSTFSIYLECHG